MKRLAALAAATATLCLHNAHAGPADYMYLPSVEYGEREIDFKFGSWKQKDQDRLSAGSVGFGYGATHNWFTEIYVKYNKVGSETTTFDAWEWENKFQITEPGQFPVDIGLITEIEKPKDHSEGYEFKWGPLFQTEFGKVQLNANLLFERKYRGTSDEARNTEMGYQFQAKYRWLPQFEYGIQAFGEMGKWNKWENSGDQNHRIGPAVFGKFALGGRQVIKYNAAYLFGTTSNSPDHTFRVQTEYEF